MTKKVPSNRVCYSCGSDKTWINKSGNPQWRIHDNNPYCHKCHNKVFANPQFAAEGKIRRITFKGKRLYVEQPPRTGVCSWCHRKIGDIYFGWRNKKYVVNSTHMHHLKYHPKDPLKDTVELCESCHKTEHWRLKKLK